MTSVRSLRNKLAPSSGTRSKCVITRNSLHYAESAAKHKLGPQKKLSGSKTEKDTAGTSLKRAQPSEKVAQPKKNEATKHAVKGQSDPKSRGDAVLKSSAVTRAKLKRKSSDSLENLSMPKRTKGVNSEEDITGKATSSNKSATSNDKGSTKKSPPKTNKSTVQPVRELRNRHISLSGAQNKGIVKCTSYSSPCDSLHLKESAVKHSNLKLGANKEELEPQKKLSESKTQKDTARESLKQAQTLKATKNADVTKETERSAKTKKKKALETIKNKINSTQKVNSEKTLFSSPKKGISDNNLRISDKSLQKDMKVLISKEEMELVKTNLSKEKSNVMNKSPQVLISKEESELVEANLSKDEQEPITKNVKSPVILIEPLQQKADAKLPLTVNNKQTLITRKKYRPKVIVAKKVSSPRANLRQRNLQNYAESSLEVTKIETKANNVKHIPIYNQFNESANKNKKKKRDLYEFRVSDDPPEIRNQKRKGKKRKKNENSSFKLKKTVQKKVLVKRPSQEYAKKISGVLENLKNKIKTNKKGQSHLPEEIQVKAKAKTVLIKRPSQAYDKKINGVLENLKNKIKTRRESQGDVPEAPNQRKDEQIQMPDDDFSDGFVEPVENDQEDSDIDDPFFGFDKPEDKAKENSRKIHVISDVLISSPNREMNMSIVTPAKFRKPNANSTMINHVFTPWRFNEINIRRNPHFISLKPSSLPSLDQEMVLDHTIVDKLDESLKNHCKTPNRIAEKSPIQTTLDDYFEGNFDNKENLRLNQLSLFDADNFSPIKRSVSSRNQVDKAKRKVLGEVNDNIILGSTPLRNQVETQAPDLSVVQSSHDDFNFGFSTDEEGDVEKSLQKDKHARPFRVSINANDKKYQRRSKKAYIAVSVASSSSDNDDEDSNHDLSDKESQNSGEYRLFEDFNTTADALTIKDDDKPRRRRKNVKWLNDSDPRPRRRKDVRTVEEEEAADKWAEEFNQMCKEVEKFPLEIE